MFFSPGTAAAEGLWLPKKAGKSSRTALLAQQIAVLDTRAATQYSSSGLDLKGKNGRSGGTVLPGYSGKYRGAFLEAAREAARKHGVPEDLFLRLVQLESGWNTAAVSTKGATGLSQLMPETADRLGVD
ncbi:MAG: transglycosylase SLT domain-containing protein, partial [Rhodobacteraceae bacterium]|nr:transglycosylase SLT domain-containing protein [Paracoccaceae bacterium]